MRFESLSDWLDWQEHLHCRPIDLGLDRVRSVLQRLHDQRPPFRVIAVAGTNGKGSSVAMLEAIIRAAGYRVGAFTSPHLLNYNERIRIGGAALPDEEICRAFGRIDGVREPVTLTYFEFSALAAIDIFYRSDIDVAVLEVGMGGRLDAVNVLDADIALITSIGIDHCRWLGNDRESIAREKAGVMRGGAPVVVADRRPPQSLLNHAAELGSPCFVSGDDFDYRQTPPTWEWCSGERVIASLPLPVLRGHHQLDNAAGVIMVAQLAEPWLKIGREHVEAGLRSVNLAGRFQCRERRSVTEILDVAHNPAAAEVLAVTLGGLPCAGVTRAVFAILKDKDIAGVVAAMTPVVDRWYIGSLSEERGAAAQEVEQRAAQFLPGRDANGYPDVQSAYRAAWSDAEPGDRIVVFGSFYTIADVLNYDHLNDEGHMARSA